MSCRVQYAKLDYFHNPCVCCTIAEMHAVALDFERCVAGTSCMQIAKCVIPEIIFGCGAIEHVGQAVARLGATRPLVVCDPGVAAAGWLDQLLPLLTAQQLQY